MSIPLVKWSNISTSGHHRLPGRARYHSSGDPARYQDLNSIMQNMTPTQIELQNNCLIPLKNIKVKIETKKKKLKGYGS